MNYYNENDPKAAAWLRELIKAGLIPKGHVDDRSIADVQPGDLRGFTQCHFFAGVAGWPEALRLAGWPESEPIWTGSCPCQPFSAAGKQKGEADERHLWPELRRLVAECRPTVAIGEQVASKAGRLWLSGVRTDLEALGYAVGAADLCAAGVSAPHIRQRLYWVADTDKRGQTAGDSEAQPREAKILVGQSGPSHLAGLVNSDGYHRHWWSGPVQVGWNGCQAEITRGGRKYRAQWRLKPGLSIVAHGIPGRVAMLRGAGNAIVPQVAAEFIRAYLATR